MTKEWLSGQCDNWPEVWKNGPEGRGIESGIRYRNRQTPLNDSYYTTLRPANT